MRKRKPDPWDLMHMVVLRIHGDAKEKNTKGTTHVNTNMDSKRGRKVEWILCNTRLPNKMCRQ